jgi:hypothetical protein
VGWELHARGGEEGGGARKVKFEEVRGGVEREGKTTESENGGGEREMGVRGGRREVSGGSGRRCRGR